MSEQDLLDLLKQARVKNEQYHITGLLLYAKDNFVQVLEGDAAAVDELYKAILNDDRNTKNTLIQRKDIDARSFPQWSMGFKTEKDIPLDMRSEYSDFFNGSVISKNIEKKQLEVENLLHWFKVCTQ